MNVFMLFIKLKKYIYLNYKFSIYIRIFQKSFLCEIVKINVIFEKEFYL